MFSSHKQKNNQYIPGKKGVVKIMHFFGGEFLGLHLFRRELLVSGRVYHGVIMCFFFEL